MQAKMKLNLIMPNKLMKLHHKSHSQPHDPHHVAFPSSDSSSELGSVDDSHQDDRKHNVLRGMKKGLERIRSFSSTSRSTPKKPSIKSLARAAENVAHVILNDTDRKRKASRVVTLPSPPPITIIRDDNQNLETLSSPPTINIVGDDNQIFETLPPTITIVDDDDKGLEKDQETIPELTHSSSMAARDEVESQGHDTELQIGDQESPLVYVEPAVPDPFLIDEADSSTSDEGDVYGTESTSQSAPYTTEPTTIPLSPSSTFPLSSPVDVNKAVPPPPAEREEDEKEEEEEQAPELYLPSLVLPTMFLPIPNTDPLTTLLNKYIYPPEKRPTRDLTGEWQHSNFHTLVMTNSWRALAIMARDRIVTTDPEDLSLILGLWYLRLSCLSRLRLFNQTTVECNNLFSVLNTVEPPESKAWLLERILPFELEVMQARLKYWAGDHMSYLDELTFLLKKCKTKARSSNSDVTIVMMWKERGARIAQLMASQLIEMKEFGAACKLLEPLLQQKYESEGLSSPALRSAIARIYLQSGHLSMAKKHIDIVGEDPNAEQSLKDMNRALLASANGEWETASLVLQRLVEDDSENFVAVNNFSVALLAQGKLKEGIEVLEQALKTSPSSVVVAEPFLFNLSTLYELRSTTAMQKKLDLLIEVAKWSGDGLKIACLKMPSN